MAMADGSDQGPLSPANLGSGPPLPPPARPPLAPPPPSSSADPGSAPAPAPAPVSAPGARRWPMAAGAGVLLLIGVLAVVLSADDASDVAGGPPTSALHPDLPTDSRGRALPVAEDVVAAGIEE